MSYKTFFSFSKGFSKTLKVPVGTLERINKHVQYIEKTLQIKRTKYMDNPEHWDSTDFKDIDDKVLCESAESHNSFVRELYDDFIKWEEKPPEQFEKITTKQSDSFFPALREITVKPKRWTMEYYRTRMDTIYEVMRGRETEGISFNSNELTEKQAAAVIVLFSEFLDENDLRLDVPNGHDYLASSYDGGYEWCIDKGAIKYEDIDEEECLKCEHYSECDTIEKSEDE